MPREDKTVMKGRIFFGIVVLVVGALLLLRSLGLINIGGIGEFVVYTPSVFIMMGLYLLIARRFRRAGGPIALMTVGAIVQLILLDLFRWNTVLPTLLIVVGLAVISGGGSIHGPRAKRRPRSKRSVNQDNIQPNRANGSGHPA